MKSRNHGRKSGEIEGQEQAWLLSMLKIGWRKKVAVLKPNPSQLE